MIAPIAVARPPITIKTKDIRCLTPAAKIQRNCDFIHARKQGLVKIACEQISPARKKITPDKTFSFRMGGPQEFPESVAERRLRA
jgi:hypothetical protein